MENPGLKLTDAEQRYFGELFSAYDVDGQEKISGSKASELLLATQLPTETLQQITELCGAKRLGHFGRPQFYLAMKLIAAAQAGLPLKMDIFSSGVEVPLPRFHRTTDHAGHPTQLPPPPSKSHNKATRQPSLKDLELSPQHQPYGPAVAGYPQVPPRESRDSSPEVHSSSDKTWTKFNQTGDGQLNWSHFEEHRQLLGNEEDSSDRHSSDDDHDVWSIADDQRDYYTNQFQLMQPDLRGKITGAVAKEFFEKSKLPVHELSKIWQLSDVDKDGALSIEEFCTAMHLVVLRRNNIELPDTLPPCLVPKMPPKGVDAVDATAYQVPPHPVTQPLHIASPKGHTPPPSKEPLSPQNKEWTKFSDSPTSTVSSPSMKPVNFDFSTASVEQDPRILHPVARRVSPDGHALPYNEQDKAGLSADACGDCRSGAAPKNIVKRLSGPVVPTAPQQTLAYVVTTEVSGDNAANSFSGATGAVPVGSQGQLPPKKEPPPPPPPRPKRNHTRSSSLDLNHLGKANPQGLGAPPAVPPRISPGNEQENEDNEEVATKSFTGDIPRALDFADFDQFAESRSDVASGPVQQLQPGAFEVYKKPSAEYMLPSPYSSESEYSDEFLDDLDSSPAPTDDSAMLLVDQTDDASEKKKRRKAPPAMAATEMKTIPNEKYGLQQAVRAHRERNNMLMLLNTELNQELVEATEERLSLELQLENLKPFSC
ncbi:RALBP1 associated Eps domain containing isoform X1 [Dermacentor variabilis]|uniref:RALBP1 associated Eps domain containing isoform X1 n=1 Tax=Dermacentor variabilis TaxID=34621 RepID=UPI003F5BC729